MSTAGQIEASANGAEVRAKKLVPTTVLDEIRHAWLGPDRSWRNVDIRDAPWNAIEKAALTVFILCAWVKPDGSIRVTGMSQKELSGKMSFESERSLLRALEVLADRAEGEPDAFGRRKRVVMAGVITRHKSYTDGGVPEISDYEIHPEQLLHWCGKKRPAEWDRPAPLKRSDGVCETPTPLLQELEAARNAAGLPPHDPLVHRAAKLAERLDRRGAKLAAAHATLVERGRRHMELVGTARALVAGIAPPAPPSGLETAAGDPPAVLLGGAVEACPSCGAPRPCPPATRERAEAGSERGARPFVPAAPAHAGTSLAVPPPALVPRTLDGVLEGVLEEPAVDADDNLVLDARDRLWAFDGEVLFVLSMWWPLTRIANDHNAALIGFSARRMGRLTEHVEIALERLAFKLNRGDFGNPDELEDVDLLRLARAFAKHQRPSVHRLLPNILSRIPTRAPPPDPTPEEIAELRAHLGLTEEHVAALREAHTQRMLDVAAVPKADPPTADERPAPEEALFLSNPQGYASFHTALARVREISAPTCDQWFGGVQFEGLDGGVLKLRAENAFVRDWVTDNFGSSLTTKLGEIEARAISIAWTIAHVDRPLARRPQRR